MAAVSRESADWRAIGRGVLIAQRCFAEDQQISTDSENILIQCFMRKRGAEAGGAIGKGSKGKGAGADKGKRPADTSAEGGHAKRSHNAEPGPSGAAMPVFYS